MPWVIGILIPAAATFLLTVGTMVNYDRMSALDNTGWPILSTRSSSSEIFNPTRTIPIQFSNLSPAQSQNENGSGRRCRRHVRHIQKVKVETGVKDAVEVKLMLFQHGQFNSRYPDEDSKHGMGVRSIGKSVQEEVNWNPPPLDHSNVVNLKMINSTSYGNGSDDDLEPEWYILTTLDPPKQINDDIGDDLSQIIVSESPPLTFAVILLVLVFSLIMILTLVGNVLVCTSLIFVKKLRKPQNYLIASLAVSDLFVALFVMPFAIVLEVYEGEWPFDTELCDLWVSADVLCCTASILNLCGISVDRYRAITTPLEYSSKTTPRRMLAVIFVVWLGSACVSLPPVLLLGNVHRDIHENSFCSVSQNFWYQIYATMASFYVPLCVMVVVYVKILRVVADKKKQMGWKPPHQSVHRTASSSITTNHSSSLCGGGTSTLLVSNSPGGGPHPQHALVTRALVTSSVGGSPVTVTTIVSNSPSTTSSPARRNSLSTMSNITAAPTPPTGARGCPAGMVPLVPTHHEDVTCGGNNNKKDSTASQNAAVTTPLLSSSEGKKNPSKSTYQKQKSNNRSNSHCVRMNSRNSLNANHSAAAGTSVTGQNHSNQNGANGSTVTYFFSSSAIHRIKKEKLFGGLKEHKASTTLGIIMSAFVICWLPFFVLALIRPFLSINGVEIPPWITSLFNWLGWANSALNPVIYATLNRDFRKPFREILCLRCATLDAMMRREFYHEQYGDDRDRENYLRRLSRPHTENEPVSTTEGPTNV